MQLNLRYLTEHLQQKLSTLYVICGDENLLVQEAIDEIRKKAREAGFSERIRHKVAGAQFDWTSVLFAVSAQSLFSEKKIVEINISSGKPGKNGGLMLQDIALLAQDNLDTLILLILPRLDKVSKSASWFSALDRHGVVVSVDSIERRLLPAWIARRLREVDLKVATGEIGQQALQFFADRVEGNLLAAHQEILKLSLLVEPGEISLEQIASVTSAVSRYDVFKLSDAVLAGEYKRIERMVDGLQAEGVPAVLVLYVLSEDIRTLKRVKTALKSGRSLAIVFKEQRVWGQKERLFEKTLPHISCVTLNHLLETAYLVDGVVKGLKAKGWPPDTWQALMRFAMIFCRACAQDDIKKETVHLEEMR